jgi:hypothetical protein
MGATAASYDRGLKEPDAKECCAHSWGHQWLIELSQQIYRWVLGASSIKEPKDQDAACRWGL